MVKIFDLKAALDYLKWDGNRWMPDEFTHQSVELSRRLIRNQLLVRAGGKCYVTGQQADDMHEIINRNRTQRGSVERWLSYQPELVSLLSRSVHDEVHNRAGREKLLQENYRRFGYDQVVLVYELLKMFSPSIMLELPEAV